MVIGPFQRIPIGGGAAADLFLLRYDGHGRLRSPRTERILTGGLAGISDVFLFAHGWNTTFATALDRCREFAAGYLEQRRRFGVPAPADYRPVLVGVVWPATSFVTPWEAGPRIAAVPPPDTAEADQVEEMLDFVTGSLAPQDDAEFTELVDGRTALGPEEARRAAEIVLAALWPEDDPDGRVRAPDAAGLLTAWSLLDSSTVAGPDASDRAPEPGARSEVSVAGGEVRDPRTLLRAATVWKTKARAGTVGARGVGPLLRRVLADSAARLHLVGHSFGARLLLSALAARAPARPAHSALLLQPAVNRWCFAPDVAGTGRPGGYHPVLQRVANPVLTTFSPHDVPLTRFFHLALRGGRPGEPSTAALGDTERCGALGGFGPAGLGPLARREPAAAPGVRRYDLTGAPRVVAVDGGAPVGGRPAIAGHGDISNAATWWALHCLTRPD